MAGIPGRGRALQQATGVKVRSKKATATAKVVPFDGVFLAIGHSPNTKVFKGLLEMTPEGYLLTRTALAWKDVEAPAAPAARPDAGPWKFHERRGSVRRPGTWSIPTTDRRSPPPAPAAPRRSTARSGSNAPTRKPPDASAGGPSKPKAADPGRSEVSARGVQAVHDGPGPFPPELFGLYPLQCLCGGHRPAREPRPNVKLNPLLEPSEIVWRVDPRKSPRAGPPAGESPTAPAGLRPHLGSGSC